MNKVFGSCDIVMSSPSYEITEQFRKSSARYAKGLSVGSVIQFRMPLQVCGGRSGGGNYVTECEIYEICADGTERLICSASPRELQGAYRTDDIPDAEASTSYKAYGYQHKNGVKPLFRLREVQ